MDLYYLFVLKKEVVNDMGVWVNNCWIRSGFGVHAMVDLETWNGLQV